MNVGIIGLGHVFEKQYAVIKDINNFEKIFICDIDDTKLNVDAFYKTNNYKELLNSCDIILIETNPETHLDIANYLLENNKKILLEKPIVLNNNELNILKKNINNKNFYNMLHFSFGVEIEWFIENLGKRPNKIYSFISDKYIKNERILDSSVNLCGAYLDETINPLSAICKMFGYNLEFISVYKKYYIGDKYDYYSLSKFRVNEIEVNIEVLWNSLVNDKYIDLYYDDKIIRLDSMNQKVIDITHEVILFEGEGNRIYNHYLGVFNDFLNNGSNIEKSMKLHEQLLRGTF